MRVYPLLLLALLLAVVPSQAQELLHTLTAPEPTALQYFGRTIAGVPDTDGDGRGELLVGMGSNLLIGIPERAFLYSGATGALRLSVASPNPQFRGGFAQALDGLDDITGDGRGDLLIGAFDEDHGSLIAAGRAYVFSGGAGTLLHQLESPDAQYAGFFGRAVASVPDADGDGIMDVLIGAPGEDAVAGVENGGRAYVFSGATGKLIHDLVASQPEESVGFGTSVSGSADIDGDGRGDLIVADSAMPSGGRVYVISGQTGAHLFELTHPSPQADDRFGSSISEVPDADGDGRSDILVGAPGNSAGSGGRAFLFSGATGALLLELVSPRTQNGGQFGLVVAGVPDANHDGRGDLLVGAWKEEGGTGRAYLFSGADGSALLDLTSPNSMSDGEFGRAVSGVPDVNGDGRGDLLIGAHSERAGNQVAAGRAYVYSGGLSAFTIAPLSLDFAQVAVGAQSAPQEVVIENGTQANLTLTSVTLQGADAASFELVTVPQLPLSLPPGAAASVEVIFAPVSAGSASASLRLEGSEGASEVGLTGFGMAADNLEVTTHEDVDDGVCDAHCTLREAVAVSNASSDMNTITFAPALAGRTIKLWEGEIALTQPVRIDAGDLGITINGNRLSRVMRIEHSEGRVELSGLRIRGGTASWGAGLYVWADSVYIDNSVIEDNNTTGYGGGIYCEFGYISMNEVEIINNKAVGTYGDGGGIWSGCSLYINDSLISNNEATDWGGGIHDMTYEDDKLTTIRNTTISGNIAGYGAGLHTGWFFEEGGAAKRRAGGNGMTRLENVTITDNQASIAGGGISKQGYGGFEYTNALVVGNTVGGDPLAPTADCIVNTLYEALGYSVVGEGTGCPTVATDETVPPAEVFTRVLSPLLAHNGGPTRTHALSYADDNPALDLGGTCGPTDQRGFPAPLDGPDPDAEAACDAGAVEASSVVVLVPENPPVVIPAAGGDLRFTFTMTNPTSQPRRVQAWARATRPQGAQTGTLLGPVTVTLAPGETVSRTLEQRISASVPAGAWTLTGFVGAHPDGAVASSSFVVTKEGPASRRADPEGEAGWPAAVYAETGAAVSAGDVWGSDPPLAEGAATLPTAYTLYGPYPNPLSSRARLGYDLPEAAPVRLVLYDVLGRAVAVLVDGERAAGRHEAALDASGLPSGTYLVRLEAGAEVHTQPFTVVR